MKDETTMKIKVTTWKRLQAEKLLGGHDSLDSVLQRFIMEVDGKNKKKKNELYGMLGI